MTRNAPASFDRTSNRPSADIAAALPSWHQVLPHDHRSDVEPAISYRNEVGDLGAGFGVRPGNRETCSVQKVEYQLVRLLLRDSHGLPDQPRQSITRTGLRKRVVAALVVNHDRRSQAPEDRAVEVEFDVVPDEADRAHLHASDVLKLAHLPVTRASESTRPRGRTRPRRCTRQPR